MMNFPEIPNTTLYLAGGAVRDFLLNRPHKDLDFVVKTAMGFDELESVVSHLPGAKVYQSRPEFLTLRCKIDGMDIDLVYPREEGAYTDKRHPDFVVPSRSLAVDSLRRDFTINAMYMDREGRVYDFHTGRKDLYGKVIRTTDNPKKTFEDDYLRMVRAWRFTCTLGEGWTIETNTATYILNNVQMLKDVPTERVREELDKALLADPLKMFHHLENYNVVPILQERGLSFMVTAKER